MEEIRHAAVKSVDGWVIIGKSHADCFHKAHHLKIKMSQLKENQGFITSEGRYVMRGEAYTIALNAGQLEVRLDNEFGTKETLLFSELIWDKEYNGRYRYDEIKGYVKHDHN